MNKRKAAGVLRTQAEMHEYCNSVRRTAGSEFRYLMEGAHELRATLAPTHRVKAWIVSWHLVLAAHACKAASAHAVASYGSFTRWFETELAEARAKSRTKVKKAAGPRPTADGFKFGEH